MTRKTWNKLVRDRIPDTLKQKGISVGTSVLHADEFLPALLTKLIEETAELKVAAPEERQEELADVLEVLKSIADECNIPWSAVEATQRAKRNERGGFTQRIVLEYTEE